MLHKVTYTLRKWLRRSYVVVLSRTALMKGRIVVWEERMELEEDMVDNAR
jgi:hypothetical protein